MQNNDQKTWIKSILALYILKILAVEAAHGNKIAEIIKQRTEQKFTPNSNALYPLLRLMEERGLVTGAWIDPNKRSKRMYSITEVGLAYIPGLQQRVTERINGTEEKIAILRKDLLVD